ncbi:ABC transporter ATP-binding protein [Raoultibacter phocaeensis]|uniref:ABC transporter ATP-binding protein n=1 Tax=Raoultibacter phocaeensis TaxID=2479841 RepID=UPI001117B606|nr:ABC transporter ATP-binding protein [Raoultibacter phocaeensis]
MLKLFRNHKALFVLTMILSIMSAALTIAAAVILENILNAVVDGNWELFTTMIWVVVGYIVILLVVALGATLAEKKLVVNAIRDLRSRVQKGILSRDTEQYRTTNTADYLSALTNDMTIIEENVIVPFLNTIQYAIIFVMAAVALFFYSPLIGGIMVASLVLMYLLPASLGKPIGKRQEAYSAGLSLFTMKVKDQFSGYDVIRSYRLADRVREDFSDQNRTLATRKYAVDKLLSVSESIAAVVGAGSQIGTMLVAGFLVLNGQMTAGALLAILQLSGAFVQPVAVIMQSIPRIQGALPVLGRLEELSTPEPSAFRGTTKPAFEKDIRFEELGFAYSEGQPVLSELDLTLEKGKKYALVGESGCGKSTLMGLLGAEHSTYSGAIRVDGTELRDLDIDELLSIMSTIHQGVYLFDETIEYNIGLGRTYSKAEWRKALDTSGVAKFLDQTESGLATRAGEMGSKLSGGQRQRIAVARALIEQKPLLILDEGTSAVDIQTAYDIENALLELEDLTMITITHNLRPELLNRYDAILFMHQGRIQETGTYDSLVERHGAFAQFQRLDCGDQAISKEVEVQQHEIPSTPGD